MNQLGEQLSGEHLAIARELIDGIPPANYAVNKQVDYEDQEKLADAMADVLCTPGVTTLDHVQAFTARLGRIAEQRRGFVVVSGDCREIIHRVNVPMSRLAERIETDLDVVKNSDLQDVEHAIRGLGQFIKPRSDEEEEVKEVKEGSDEEEEVKEGSDEEEEAQVRIVPSYKGHLINDEHPDLRVPNPDYLVEGAVQARDLRGSLDERLDYHLPVMHEALSLHYELPQIRRDPATGAEFSVSGDALWSGVRTNALDGVIIAMLRRLRNTTGVKIDGSSDEEHIVGLEEALNPDGIPGKSLYMLRLVPADFHKYPKILKTLKQHAPFSPVLFDIHGSTEQVNGVKIRHVGNVIRNMKVMAHACFEAGVYFGGLSVETIADRNRLECIDEYGQQPEPGGIDPGANPLQFGRILNAAAALVEQQAKLQNPL